MFGKSFGISVIRCGVYFIVDELEGNMISYIMFNMVSFRIVCTDLVGFGLALLLGGYLRRLLGWL